MNERRRSLSALNTAGDLTKLGFVKGSDMGNYNINEILITAFAFPIKEGNYLYSYKEYYNKSIKQYNNTLEISKYNRYDNPEHIIIKRSSSDSFGWMVITLIPTFQNWNDKSTLFRYDFTPSGSTAYESIYQYVTKEEYNNIEDFYIISPIPGSVYRHYITYNLFLGSVFALPSGKTWLDYEDWYFLVNDAIMTFSIPHKVERIMNISDAYLTVPEDSYGSFDKDIEIHATGTYKTYEYSLIYNNNYATNSYSLTSSDAVENGPNSFSKTFKTISTLQEVVSDAFNRGFPSDFMYSLGGEENYFYISISNSDGSNRHLFSLYYDESVDMNNSNTVYCCSIGWIETDSSGNIVTFEPDY